MQDEFYIPSPQDIGVQSSTNRQGRGEEVDPLKAQEFLNWLTSMAINGYENYQHFLNDDGTGKAKDPLEPMIARELARMGLPQNLYTEVIWKCDLHNIFHFLGLRMEGRAQKEIREYANAMAQIVRDSFPISYKAFEDYELNAIQLSAPEQSVLIEVLKRHGVVVTKEEILRIADNQNLKNKGERNELMEKLSKLQIFK
jgi:thymidylate synthase (FAD)